MEEKYIHIECNRVYCLWQTEHAQETYRLNIKVRAVGTEGIECFCLIHELLCTRIECTEYNKYTNSRHVNS